MLKQIEAEKTDLLKLIFFFLSFVNSSSISIQAGKLIKMSALSSRLGVSVHFPCVLHEHEGALV